MRRTLLTIALLLCSVAIVSTQKDRKPVTHTVTIDATSYSPATITVAPGDTVVWVNKDVIPHTATSRKEGVFDSGTIASGDSWKHTFKTKGELDYFCQFHPTMKGVLRVK